MLHLDLCKPLDFFSFIHYFNVSYLTKSPLFEETKSLRVLHIELHQVSDVWPLSESPKVIKDL